MSNKEKQALERLAEVIPKLSDSNKEYILGVADGMSLAIQRHNDKLPPEDGTPPEDQKTA